MYVFCTSELSNSDSITNSRQNNVTELYSLIKFLRIKPLSNWDTFNNQIAKPVNNGRGASRAMKCLQVCLLFCVLFHCLSVRRFCRWCSNKSCFVVERIKHWTAMPWLIYPSARSKSLHAHSMLMNRSSMTHSNQRWKVSLKSWWLVVTMEEEAIISLSCSFCWGSVKVCWYIAILETPRMTRPCTACNHPILVSKDYKKDSEALEPKGVEKGKTDKEADADDDLIAAFGQLGVTKKCQMCTNEWALFL